MSIINVETFTWMKPIKARNTSKTYLMIGQVKGVASTLLVTLEGGNGGAVMFCQKHDFAYPIKGKCAECQNTPREETTDASVTARNTG
ncbi:MAG: hypothetical protein HY865_00910 [Chloroflexi bacterium]|nr:hypothetical protein [Chloroflexota bacterium]